MSSNLTVSAKSTGTVARRLRTQASMSKEDETSDRERMVFAEFAQACRRERDRIARAELEAQDCRFEMSTVERTLADALAARLIAAAAR